MIRFELYTRRDGTFRVRQLLQSALDNIDLWVNAVICTDIVLFYRLKLTIDLIL